MSTPHELVKAGPGTVMRQEFAGSELQQTAETSGAVLAAQARAMVEARFVMALRRPRDFDDVRAKLLKACERPGFAGSATESVWGAAWFRKPQGDGVEGFSIRFAEEAMRAMGNVDVQSVTVYDDEHKRILTVTVTDLESNSAYQTSLSIEKTVERKRLRPNEMAMRTRIGARGEPVYIVPATDDEVFQKQQALASKAIRNAVLRILPGDIQAECRTRILAIRRGDAAKDPDGFKKRVVDGFAQLNIMPSDLGEYLGHDLAQSSPAELTDLRDLWTAIKDGKTTWAEELSAALEERGDTKTDTASGEAKPKPGINGLTDRLKQTASAKIPPATQESTEMTAEESARFDQRLAEQDRPASGGQTPPASSRKSPQRSPLTE